MAKERVVRETPQERMERELKMEFMRNQVLEVELQARYWKGLHDTKYWTLEDNKLKADYEKYFIEVQNKATEAAAQIEKIVAMNGGTMSASDDGVEANVTTEEES